VDQRAHPAGGGEIPFTSHAYGAGGEAGATEASRQRRVRKGDDERLVPAIPLASGEQKDLALSTAPIATAIDVQDAKGHLLAVYVRAR
jgi:hypothetical protein